MIINTNKYIRMTTNCVKTSNSIIRLLSASSRATTLIWLNFAFNSFSLAATSRFFSLRKSFSCLMDSRRTLGIDLSLSLSLHEKKLVHTGQFFRRFDQYWSFSAAVEQRNVFVIHTGRRSSYERYAQRTGHTRTHAKGDV